MNPAIALDQKLQFKFYGSKALKVGLGVRETGTTVLAVEAPSRIFSP